MAEPTAAQVTACTLTVDALDERVSSWRDLTSKAVHRETRPGHIVTTYPNEPEIARSLVQLVEAERECCPFLEFEIREEDAALTVELRYPAHFAAMIDAVLG